MVWVCLSSVCSFFCPYVHRLRSGGEKAADPIIDLKLFHSKLFVVVNIVAALASGFLMGIDVYIPMWMQGVLGMSAGIGGLVLAPLSILWMIGSLASRWLTQHSVSGSWRLACWSRLPCVAVFDTSTDVILVVLGHFFYYWRRVGATMVVCTVTAQTSVGHASRRGDFFQYPVANDRANHHGSGLRYRFKHQ